MTCVIRDEGKFYPQILNIGEADKMSVKSW